MLAEAIGAISLVCQGGLLSEEVRRGSAFSLHNPANQVMITGTETVGYDEEIRVELNDSGGRITVPKPLRSTLSGSGDNGWWELKKPNISTDMIEAKIYLSFANRPTIRISRLTGRLVIDGRYGSFSGVCQPYDPATAVRKF